MDKYFKHIAISFLAVTCGLFLWQIYQPKTSDQLGAVTSLVNTMTGSTSMAIINTNFSFLDGSKLDNADMSGGEGITYTATGTFSFDCSEVEGTGINCSGEDIVLDNTGDWAGTVDGVDSSTFVNQAYASSTFPTLTYGSSTYFAIADWYSTTSAPQLTDLGTITQLDFNNASGTDLTINSDLWATNITATGTFTGNLTGASGVGYDAYNRLVFTSTGLTSLQMDGTNVFRASGTQLTFNLNNDDMDFIIDGDNNDNVFYLDASTDRIGIGTTAPAYLLDVYGDIRADGTGYIDELCFADTGNCQTDVVSVGTDITLYYQDVTTDITGYEGLRTYPANGSETVDTATSAGSVYNLIDPYVSTTTDFSITTFPAGLWRFRAWANVDSSVGVTYIVNRVYKRNAAGAETLLFMATSSEMTTGLKEYLYNGVSASSTFLTTDRIVVKNYCWSDSVSERTCSLYYDGADHYSHIVTPISIAELDFTRAVRNETITGNWTFGNLTSSLASITNASTTAVSATTLYGNLTCTNCINATEVEDIYLLNSGDDMTGNLTLTDGSGDSPTLSITSETGSARLYTSLKDFYIYNPESAGTIKLWPNDSTAGFQFKSAAGNTYLYASSTFNIVPGTALSVTGITNLVHASTTDVTATAFYGDLIGTSSYAVAFKTNPTDCGGGEYANAIDASGNLTCSTPSGSGASTTDFTIHDDLWVTDIISTGTASFVHASTTDLTASANIWAEDIITNDDITATGDITGAIIIGNYLATNIVTLPNQPAFTYVMDQNSGLYFSGSDVIGLSTNGTARLTIDATGLLTFGNATSTDLTVNSDLFSTNITATGTAAFSGILKLPNGAALTTNSAGEIVIDTTSDQLRYYGTATRTLSYIQPSTFTIASTTWTSVAGTATSTIPLGTAPYAESWDSAYCYTDVGTAWLAFGDGSATTSSLQASTTANIFNFTTNQTFTAGEKRYIDIGSFASTPNFVTCTLRKSVTAD